MKRWVLMLALVAALCGGQAAMAGPRADAIAGIGVSLSLPDGLSDADLTVTKDGCVILDTDTTGLIVCRFADQPLRSKGDLLIMRKAWQEWLYAKLAVDPSSPMPSSAQSLAPGQSLQQAVDAEFVTTANGLYGLPGSATFTGHDRTSVTIRTFTTAAPNDDAIVLVVATHPDSAAGEGDYHRIVGTLAFI